MNRYNRSTDNATEVFQYSLWKKHYIGANFG